MNLEHPSAPALVDLIRRMDDLEEHAPGYLTLDQVRSAGMTEEQVRHALEQDVLLVDQRQHLDPRSGALAAVVLCRLNRQHPRVRSVLGAFG